MPETDLAVRYASSDDLSFVGQDGYLSPDVLVRKIVDGDVFIAERGAIQVGYLRLEYLWSRHPYVTLIRVVDPHKHAGVGRAILSFVESAMSGQGHAFLYSSSQVDEPESQAWHRRMGFDECGFLAGVNDHGIGEIFFRKMLGTKEA